MNEERDHRDKTRFGKAGLFWSRLSPVYKRRVLQGAGAYLALVACVALWLFIGADKTVREWNARIPQAIVVLEPPGGDDTAPVIADGGADTDYPLVTPLPDDTAPDDSRLSGGASARIAIILTDAGLSENMTLRAQKELPAEIGLAFSPYSPRLQPWLEEARQARRETFLLLPMEPLTYPKDDPGPRALLSRKSGAENREALHWLLAQGRPTGVMNFMGSRFLADRANMMPALEQLRHRGLVFIENPSMAGLQSAASFASEAGVPYISADVKIDITPERNAIRQQLVQLEKAAEQRGAALGIASPYPVTLDVLREWAAGLERRGFVLSPPTSLLRQDASPPSQRSP